MFWTRKQAVLPKLDRVAMFRGVVDEAIRNATARSDWVTKIQVAAALEDFARAVRCEIARGGC